MADGQRSDVGRGPAIVAFLGAQALGDLIMSHLVAASVARALPESRLGVIYRDNRPYKHFVTALNPSVDQVLKLPDDPGTVLPLDWFAGRADAPAPPFDAAWIEAGLHRPDIFLVPAMLNLERSVGRPPVFRVPDAIAPLLAQSLVRRGLRADRWFACLHVRGPGYQWRKDVDFRRNAPAETYLTAIEDILSAGGQVVRLGDPSMEPLPAMEGLVDLSRDAESFPEQCFAVSRARFFLGTDSGPTQLACGFRVPAASTNALGIGVWNDGDVVLYKRFALAGGGRALTTADLLSMTGYSMQICHPIEGFDVTDNSPDELAAVARHMITKTVDCAAWREPASESEEPVSANESSVGLPLPWRPITEIGDLTVWPHEGT